MAVFVLLFAADYNFILADIETGKWFRASVFPADHNCFCFVLNKYNTQPLYLYVYAVLCSGEKNGGLLALHSKG